MHPVFERLERDERSLAWLARRIGYAPEYVGHVKTGFHPASPRFRRRVCEFFGLPESELFHGTPEGSVGTTGHDGDRAQTAVISGDTALTGGRL